MIKSPWPLNTHKEAYTSTRTHLHVHKINTHLQQPLTDPMFREVYLIKPSQVFSVVPRNTVLFLAWHATLGYESLMKLVQLAVVSTFLSLPRLWV